MNKEEFKVLFERALEVAAQNAEEKIGHAVPREFEIEFHGKAPNPRILRKEEALEEIYIDADRFYRIINVAVRRISKGVTTVFVGISGHAPGRFDQTWNRPSGSGPFKQVLANDLRLA